MIYALLSSISFWIAMLAAGPNGNSGSLALACSAAGLSGLCALIEGASA